MAKVFPADFVDLHDATIRMYTDGNYWFYHQDSHPSDHPLKYQNIVASASSSVEIWDPYFNIGDEGIFNQIHPNIDIKILTIKGLLRHGNATYLTDIETAMRSVIPASSSIRFGMRVVNSSDPAKFVNLFFHDRFLIIDETQVYCIGSSVRWHLDSQGPTGILKVENTETCLFIKCLFDEYWRQSGRHEIPVRFLHP